MPGYLAVDLGAESGRVLRGDFDGERLTVQEVHRFPNDPLRGPDDLCWDVEPLFAGVVDGITRGVAAGPGARSVGVDAWGNDFGLLDGRGDLLAPPWHHRTPRTAGAMERLLERVDADEVYAITGTQFLPITTACQLVAIVLGLRRRCVPGVVVQPVHVQAAAQPHERLAQPLVAA